MGLFRLYRPPVPASSSTGPGGQPDVGYSVFDGAPLEHRVDVAVPRAPWAAVVVRSPRLTDRLPATPGALAELGGVHRADHPGRTGGGPESRRAPGARPPA